MANTAYSPNAPLLIVAPPAKQVTSAPGNSTLAYDVGQVLIVKAVGATPASAYMLLSKLVVNGIMTANWSQIDNESGGGVFGTLTVTPGPTTLTGVFGTAGGAASINVSSNFNTAINTGTSTGTVGIGNSLAGALTVASGAASTMTFGANSASALTINASHANGGLILQAGANGILIGDEADTAVLDLGNIAPTASRTITAGGGTVITAVTDTINVGVGGVSTNAGATKVTNVGTGSTTLGTQTVNVGTGNRVSGTQALNLSTGTGTKTIGIGNADALTTITVAGITSVNATVNANTNINTGTSTGAVAIGNTLAGAMTIDSGTADITLTATGKSINLVATEAAADGIKLNASNAAGGIQLTTGGGAVALSSAGAVSMVPATDTQASATSTSTINFRVFVVTFTGFTTAAAGTQVFTIVNSTHVAGSGVLLSIANKGTNDAQMSITRINTTTAGTIAITTKNNGAAALNGDVVITGWVIS